MKLSKTPYLVTSDFIVFGKADAFATKEEAIEFANSNRNKIVWFKPTGQRKVCPHDKSIKVYFV